MSVVFVEFSVCVFKLTWCYTNIVQGSPAEGKWVKFRVRSGPE